MGETNMAVTEKKKKKGSYLLLHRSGTVAKTKTLFSDQTIDGITAIVNLDTLEQFNGEKWEEIPDGYETLIEAEDELVEAENEISDSDEENVIPDFIQSGAKRILNPNLLWAVCKKKFNTKME